MGDVRIAEFSGLTGISPRLLRHYEARGWLRPAASTSGGHRRYHPEQVATARLLVALARTGLSLPEAAAMAAARDPEQLRAHAEQVEDWAQLVRGEAEALTRIAAVERRTLPASIGVVVSLTVPVHRVADSIRELRVSLRAGEVSRRQRHPVDSAWPDGPDGPWAELVRPSYAAATLDLRVLLPWSRRANPPPAIPMVRTEPRVVHVVEVTPWTRATVVEVHSAHRALDAASTRDDDDVLRGDPCCDGGRRWQLYDGPMQRMWVARECGSPSLQAVK